MALAQAGESERDQRQDPYSLPQLAHMGENLAQRDCVAHGDPWLHVLSMLLLLSIHDPAVNRMWGHTGTAHDESATASGAGVQRLGHWMEPQSSTLERRKEKLYF